jgi:hypothetical protein
LIQQGTKQTEVLRVEEQEVRGPAILGALGGSNGSILPNWVFGLLGEQATGSGGARPTFVKNSEAALRCMAALRRILAGREQRARKPGGR